MTNDLLTTKEVQDLLNVDRTTVYRMLKDKRLKGVRIGLHWRFPRHEIDALLEGTQPSEAKPDGLDAILPIHCMQPTQDVFAQIAEVGSLTTAPNGEPLTEMSNACRFCQLILASESGRRACVESWRQLAKQPRSRPEFVTCHAGLQYARARIELDGQLVALVIAGQFYDERPSEADELERVARLAGAHELDIDDLAEAAKFLPQIDERKRAQIGEWLAKVADTFQRVTEERASYIARLQHIAALSSLGTAC